MPHCKLLHPGRLRWNLRIHHWKSGNPLNQTIVFRFKLLIFRGVKRGYFLKHNLMFTSLTVQLGILKVPFKQLRHRLMLGRMEQWRKHGSVDFKSMAYGLLLVAGGFTVLRNLFNRVPFTYVLLWKNDRALGQVSVQNTGNDCETGCTKSKRSLMWRRMTSSLHPRQKQFPFITASLDKFHHL